MPNVTHMYQQRTIVDAVSWLHDVGFDFGIYTPPQTERGVGLVRAVNRQWYIYTTPMYTNHTPPHFTLGAFFFRNVVR